MADYQPPPPEVAEYVYEANAECERQRQRLEGASAQTAWTIATNRGESTAARMEAILVLARKRDPRMTELILSLFDDPDTDVWSGVIRSFHPDDPRIRERLRERAQSEDIGAAAEALCVLAMMKDECALTVCRDWLTGAQGQRNAAVEALRILGSGEAKKLLESRWDEELPSDEDRHALAFALVQFGHPSAIVHAQRRAELADDDWAVAAATSIYISDKPTGLRLMRKILDEGQLAARQGMVGQISSLAGHLLHEYTADGIYEARLWVEKQIEALPTA